MTIACGGWMTWLKGQESKGALKQSSCCTAAFPPPPHSPPPPLAASATVGAFQLLPKSLRSCESTGGTARQNNLVFLPFDMQRPFSKFSHMDMYFVSICKPCVLHINGIIESENSLGWKGPFNPSAMSRGMLFCGNTKGGPSACGLHERGYAHGCIHRGWMSDSLVVLDKV